MNLRLQRFSSGVDDTLGVLFQDDQFICFTLEDEYRTQKVYGETRIPDGTYEVRLRNFGGFHERYSQRFPEFHIGMLWLQNVPNFENILIHIGNKDDDTAGCILVGDTCQQNITESGFIGNSTSAYKRIYPAIARAIRGGEQVWIEVRS